MAKEIWKRAVADNNFVILIVPDRPPLGKIKFHIQDPAINVPESGRGKNRIGTTIVCSFDFLIS